MELKDFCMGYRFTDEKYALFNPHQLALINILSSDEAESLWYGRIKAEDENFGKTWLFREICRGHGTEKRLSLFIADCDWGGKCEHKTGNILSVLFRSNNIKELAVLYDPRSALRVNAALFCGQWSDFCYPSDIAYIITDTFFMVYYEDTVFISEGYVRFNG